VAVWPAVTVWLNGCVVICGWEITVNVTLALFAVPKALLNTTRKLDPLSALVRADVV
jgi:hypothetical protein